jgi:hypothetical protein
MKNDIKFAWVKNGRIKHAGKIIGYNGPMRLLSGAGMKSYQRAALWVPVEELKPLDQVADYPRTTDSYSQSEQKKRKSR